jgi:ribosomal protein L16 Arg81 hydroxylase
LLHYLRASFLTRCLEDGKAKGGKMIYETKTRTPSKYRYWVNGEWVEEDDMAERQKAAAEVTIEQERLAREELERKLVELRAKLNSNNPPEN